MTIDKNNIGFADMAITNPKMCNNTKYFLTPNK